MKTLTDPSVQNTDYEKNVGQYHATGDDFESITDARYYAELAKKWAENPEGLPVAGFQFSALHHAIKAATSATNAANSEIQAGNSADLANQYRLKVVELTDRAESAASSAEQDAAAAQVAIQTVIDERERALLWITEEGDKQSERLDTETAANVQRVVTEGNAQIGLVTQEGDTQVQRVIDEGDAQVGRITTEGDTQEARIIAEGDTQHGRAKVEADRAQTIANDLDDAARWSGYFAPSGGSYPAPRDQTKPFQWIAADDGTVDGLAWKAGELLFYAPNPTNAQLDGAYFKLSGEATDSPIDPQPIEIPDDLVMQQDKEIYFRNPANELVQFGTLDADGDILVGEATEGLPAAPKIGLAANELYHIKELDSTGKATILFPIVTTEGGAVARDPSTVLRTYGDVSISGVKKFVEPIHVLNDLLLMNMHGDIVVNQDADGNTYVQAGDKVDFRSPNRPQHSTDGATAHPLAYKSEVDAKAPTSHTHAIANVTDLQTELDALQTGIDGKAPTSHTHTIANVTDLQTELDGKAPTSHTHTIANVTDLQTELDGKASTSHTHTIANVTDLQAELDGKAATAHTHTIANVTDLQAELDGKAATAHTHSNYAPLAGAAFTGAVTSTGDITAFLGGRSAAQQQIDAYIGNTGTTAYEAVAKLVEVVQDLQAQIDALKTP